MSLYDPLSSSPNEERPDLSRIRRYRSIALIASLAALAALLAACGGSGGSEDPRAVVESASLEGLESGVLDAKVSVTSSGQSGGRVDLELSGPFQRGAAGSLPQLAMEVSAKGEADGEPISFEGGLTMLSDRAFLALEGSEYEVDPTTFGLVKSGFERAAQEGGEEAGEGGVTACQEAAEGLNLEGMIDNLESKGGADVAGTSTTKVSGDVNVAGAVDGLIELLESPACSAQLEAAGGLPLGEIEQARGELSSMIKKSHVEVYVGDDDIVRKVVAELTVEPPETGESVRMDIEATLSEVNAEQTIEAPAKAQPLEDLFRELGVNPLELLEGLSGGGAGGIGGLGGLLEGLGGGTGGIGGGSSGGGLGDESQLEYVECLQSAESEADLQKCASLLR